MTGQCSVCGNQLIKGPVKNGMPLTNEEDKNRILSEESYRRTLECQECGGLCYSKKHENEPSRQGICKKCGGIYSNTRPKDVLKLEQCHHKYPNMWHCSVHGSVQN